jgi:feruloyl esterase
VTTRSCHLPPLEYVHRRVVDACKVSDTGAPSDTFLTDARDCRFDFDSLVACDRDRQTECVSATQREALKKIYSGPKNLRTGQQIYAGMPLGSEVSKGGILTQEDSHPPNLYLFRWAFGAGFDPMTFDFDKDEKELDAKTAKILNANSPDLRAFHDLGGKLLMFSGTADGLVPYPDTLAYYERVVKFESPKVTSTSDSNRSLTNTRK